MRAERGNIAGIGGNLMSRTPGVCGQCYCASTAQRHPPRLDRIIDHHYIKTDKASGLVDLINHAVTVSTRTVEIVEELPSLEQTIARLGGGRYGRAPAPPRTQAHRP